MYFLESQIITRFGIPISFVFDNASYFSSLKMTKFCLDKGIKMKFSNDYHQQGNGLAESTNKNLIQFLKKFVQNHQRNWHNQLSNALWADRFTPKRALGNSPYFLVESILPPNIFLPSIQLAQ